MQTRQSNSRPVYSLRMIPDSVFISDENLDYGFGTPALWKGTGMEVGQ